MKLDTEEDKIINIKTCSGGQKIQLASNMTISLQKLYHILFLSLNYKWNKLYYAY